MLFQINNGAEKITKYGCHIALYGYFFQLDKLCMQVISKTEMFAMVYRHVVSTGLLAHGHLIWPLGHLLLDSTGPDWPPKFKI